MPHERGTQPELPGGGIAVSTHLAFLHAPRKILGRFRLEGLPGGLTSAKKNREKNHVCIMYVHYAYIMYIIMQNVNDFPWSVTEFMGPCGVETHIYIHTNGISTYSFYAAGMKNGS